MTQEQKDQRLAAMLESLVLGDREQTREVQKTEETREEIERAVSQCRYQHERRSAEMGRIRRDIHRLERETAERIVQLEKLRKADADAINLCADQVCKTFGIEPCDLGRGTFTGKKKKWIGDESQASDMNATPNATPDLNESSRKRRFETKRHSTLQRSPDVARETTVNSEWMQHPGEKLG